jgi:CRP-like cAMP-binding protein
MAGEFVDLQHIFLEVSDHNVQAMTRVEAAFVPREAIRQLVRACPAVGVAMWTDTLVDSSILREWTVNIGRRDARTRLAHLLCEFALRLEAAGLGEGGDFELPMTQEQIADATGLTPIHVNRVLKELAHSGMVVRERRSVRIVDWEGLRKLGDFNSRYLHIGEHSVRDRSAVEAMPSLSNMS